MKILLLFLILFSSCTYYDIHCCHHEDLEVSVKVNEFSKDSTNIEI